MTTLIVLTDAHQLSYETVPSVSPGRVKVMRIVTMFNIVLTFRFELAAVWNLSPLLQKGKECGIHEDCTRGTTNPRSECGGGGTSEFVSNE
jgi:hypothetical protein